MSHNFSYKYIPLVLAASLAITPISAMDEGSSKWRIVGLAAVVGTLSILAYTKCFGKQATPQNNPHKPGSITIPNSQSEKLPVISNSPLQWDWKKIDVDDIKFPENFRWGVATSDFQISGTASANGKHIENNWTRAMNGGYPNQTIIPAQIGIAHDHWNRYEEDVQLIKNVGFSEHRFSICWSKVMPKENGFDEDAINHYIDVTKKHIKKGITPYVMLFHHEWPLWFDQKDAFEKAENNKYFVNYANYVFDRMRENLSSKEICAYKMDDI